MRITILPIILLLSLGCSSIASESGDNVIGRVEEVTGQPSVIRGTQLRNIGPRTAISPGDTILANPGGTARIKMTDGSLFALRDNGQVTFQAYTRDEVVVICSGGTLMVTPGRYARQDSHEFTIRTPLAEVVPRRGRFWLSQSTDLLNAIMMQDGELTIRNHLGEQALSQEGESSSVTFVDPPDFQITQSLPLQ